MDFGLGVTVLGFSGGSGGFWMVEIWRVLGIRIFGGILGGFRSLGAVGFLEGCW